MQPQFQNADKGDNIKTMITQNINLKTGLDSKTINSNKLSLMPFKCNDKQVSKNRY